METESGTSKETEQPVETELGERLSRARQDLDLSLEKAAASLKVDVAVLNNLETENFDALGAPVFVRGHLRKYARMLNLPEQELLDVYQAKAGDKHADLSSPILRETVTMSRRGRRWNFGLIFLVVMLVAVQGAAVWWWFSFRELDVVHDTVLERRSQNQDSALEGKGTVSLALPGTESASESSAAPEAADAAPVSREQVEPTDKEQPADRQQEPVQVEEAPAPVMPGAAPPEEPVGRQVLLVLEFEEDSWAEIHDGNRKRVLYGLLRAGTRRELNVPAPISIYLGHVQGVSLSVDGEAYPVPAGQRSGNTARFVVDPSPETP